MLVAGVEMPVIGNDLGINVEGKSGPVTARPVVRLQVVFEIFFFVECELQNVGCGSERVNVEMRTVVAAQN